MNKQINVRLPGELVDSANAYAKKNGYGTLQELMKDAIRDKISDRQSLTREEISLIKRLVQTSEKNKLFGTEEELFKKLRGK